MILKKLKSQLESYKGDGVIDVEYITNRLSELYLVEELLSKKGAARDELCARGDCPMA